MAPTATVASEQLIADLRAAAVVQRDRGWTPGRYHDPVTGCLCTVGAIRVAITGQPELRNVPRGPLLARAVAAEDAVNRYLHASGLLEDDPLDAGEQPCNWATSWSDTVCRSTEESAALLDATADALRALPRPADPVAVYADEVIAALDLQPVVEVTHWPRLVQPGPQPDPALRLHPGSLACDACYAELPEQYAAFPTVCPHWTSAHEQRLDELGGT